MVSELKYCLITILGSGEEVSKSGNANAARYLNKNKVITFFKLLKCVLYMLYIHKPIPTKRYPKAHTDAINPLQNLN
jgi:hypothetical protein